MRASEMENKIYKQRFLSTKKKVYDKREKEKVIFWVSFTWMESSAVVLLSLYNSYGLSLSERMRKREREREW